MSAIATITKPRVETAPATVVMAPAMTVPTVPTAIAPAIGSGRANARRRAITAAAMTPVTGSRGAATNLQTRSALPGVTLARPSPRTLRNLRV